METINFKELFEKNCYEVSVGDLLLQTGEVLREKSNLVMEMFVEPLQGFFNLLLDYQKRKLDEPVRQVCISFLRSAMYLGNPVLLVEAYTNTPFLVKPVMSCELNAAWMFPCWEKYQEKMEERIRQQALGRYVREPERKSYDSKAVSAVLGYLVIYLKYMVRQLEQYPEWKELEQTKDFTISYGEYMDWQLTLNQIRDEIDPFLCSEKEDMHFRKFEKQCYEEKTFPDWIMDDSIFRECTFRKVTFRGTRFRMTRFFDCIFEDCHFQEVEMGGSSILSSRVKNTGFENCRLLDGFYRQGKAKVLYPPVVFRWSLLESVHWEETPIEEKCFVDCQIFDETERENEIFQDTSGSADIQSDRTERH
ncbi:MAG: pentapeptide repeat-containing protein [Acetatifactor sp.]|nr:pentapeptide repeat-containing protein [Acetatifactor sp.]